MYKMRFKNWFFYMYLLKNNMSFIKKHKFIRNQFDRRFQRGPSSSLRCRGLPSSIGQSLLAEFWFLRAPMRSLTWEGLEWCTCTSRWGRSSRSQCPTRCSCLHSRTGWCLPLELAKKEPKCLAWLDQQLCLYQRPQRRLQCHFKYICTNIFIYIYIFNHYV